MQWCQSGGNMPRPISAGSAADHVFQIPSDCTCVLPLRSELRSMADQLATLRRHSRQTDGRSGSLLHSSSPASLPAGAHSCGTATRAPPAAGCSLPAARPPHQPVTGSPASGPTGSGVKMGEAGPPQSPPAANGVGGEHGQSNGTPVSPGLAVLQLTELLRRRNLSGAAS